MKKTLAAAAVGLLLAACSNTEPASSAGADDFVHAVRANDMAAGYDNEQLTIMHGQLCNVVASGNDPEQILDNYSLLTGRERQEMADVVTTTCEE